MTPAESATHALTALGLTTLEAELYRFLLQESPATGYRIAQGTGKPTANVYKALESLLAKSAVLVEEAESRRFRPVGVDELLDRLQRDFERHREQARRALARLPEPAPDDGIYHLEGRDGVLERCRRMVEGASTAVLVDAFPVPLRALAPDLERCAGRGVRVTGKAYADGALDGIELVVPPDPDAVRARWPVQWLNLVVDAQELLICAFDREGDGVLEALWSRNVYLAFILEGALANEIAFSAVRGAHRLAGDDDAVHVAIALGESLLGGDTPGFHRLRRLLGLEEGPLQSDPEDRS